MENLIKLQEVDDRSRSNQRRIETLEKDLRDYRDIVSSISTISTKQQTMENDVKEIKTDIKTIKDKPAKRWDAVVDKIIMTLLGAAIAFLLAKAGIV